MAMSDKVKKGLKVTGFVLGGAVLFGAGVFVGHKFATDAAKEMMAQAAATAAETVVDQVV